MTETNFAINDSSADFGKNLSCNEEEHVSSLVLAGMFPEHCKQYVYLMFGKVFPILAVIVTISNLIVVTVFLKPKIRSHISLLLTLIAISDVLNILCPCMVFVYFYTCGNYIFPVPFHLCRWAYYFGTVFKDMFNTFSLWLTVTLAYIRTRCITSPFAACEIHSKRNILIAISAAGVLAIIVHAPSLVAYDFHALSTSSNSSDVAIYNTCHVTVSDFLGPCLLRKIHMWLEVVLSSFLPCLLLISFSIRMLISLKTAEETRDLLYTYRPMQVNTARNTTAKFEDVKGDQKDREFVCNNETKSRRYNGMGDGLNNSDSLTYHGAENDRISAKDEKRSTILSDKKVNFPGASLLRNIKAKVKQKKPVIATKMRRDSAYEKLNRESRRTSWYILLVVTIICSHELPLAGLYSYTLVTHQERLPAVLYGCSTVLIILWQYLTYSLIFLIYCCMCSAFRTELRNTVTCGNKCKSATLGRRFGQRIFTSPCLVRRHLSKRNNTADECTVFLNEEERRL